LPFPSFLCFQSKIEQKNPRNYSFKKYFEYGKMGIGAAKVRCLKRVPAAILLVLDVVAAFDRSLGS
jgi:hypothetical protein